MTRVGLVGCGRVGRKRAAGLTESRLVAVADLVRDRALSLASEHPGCSVSTDWEEIVRRGDVDLVIVATTPEALSPIARAAAMEGKHVLVEKPGARSPAELREVSVAGRRSGVTVHVGFNHRFHPALRKAKSLFEQGAVGPLLCIRGRYGHGGRPGYQREWRCDPRVAGGGELMDQGIHLVDLARWFGGDFGEVSGHLASLFWDAPVEDNAFLCLKNAAGHVAWLHASWTEWKNLFSFEVFGTEGKLEVEGLGGSYGLERLSLHRMRAEMGPPDTTAWEFPGEDASWREEFREVLAEIRGSAPSVTLDDALAALEIVSRIYDRTPVTRKAVLQRDGT